MTDQQQQQHIKRKPNQFVDDNIHKRQRFDPQHRVIAYVWDVIALDQDHIVNGFKQRRTCIFLHLKQHISDLSKDDVNGISIILRVDHFKSYCFQHVTNPSETHNVLREQMNMHCKQLGLYHGLVSGPVSVQHARALHGYQGVYQQTNVGSSRFVRWEFATESARKTLLSGDRRRRTNNDDAMDLSEVHITATERFMFDTNIRVGSWISVDYRDSDICSDGVIPIHVDHILTANSQLDNADLPRLRICSDIECETMDLSASIPPPIRVASFNIITSPPVENHTAIEHPSLLAQYPIARWDERLAYLRNVDSQTLHRYMANQSQYTNPVTTIILHTAIASHHDNVSHQIITKYTTARSKSNMERGCDNVYIFDSEREMIQTFLRVISQSVDLLVGWKLFYEYECQGSIQYLLRRMSILDCETSNQSNEMLRMGRVPIPVYRTWDAMARYTAYRDNDGMQAYSRTAPSQVNPFTLIPYIDLFDVHLRKYPKCEARDLRGMYMHVTNNTDCIIIQDENDIHQAMDATRYALSIASMFTNLIFETIHMATFAHTCISDVWGCGVSHQVESKVMSYLSSSQNHNTLRYVLATTPSLRDFIRCDDTKQPQQKFDGGLCMTDPEQHFHTGELATLDFSGYYPSLIASCAMCYTNVWPVVDDNADIIQRLVKQGRAYVIDISNHSSDMEQEVAYIIEDDGGDTILNTDQVHRALNTCRTRNPLTHLISEIIAERAVVKTALRELTSNHSGRRGELLARDSVLKSFNNSFFGVLGYQFSNIYNPILAASITAWGRLIIRSAISTISRCIRIQPESGEIICKCIGGTKLDTSNMMRMECVHVDTDGMDMMLVRGGDDSGNTPSIENVAQRVCKVLNIALARFDPTNFPYYVFGEMKPSRMRSWGRDDNVACDGCLFSMGCFKEHPETIRQFDSTQQQQHSKSLLSLGVESIATSIFVLSKKQRVIYHDNQFSYHGTWNAKGGTARVCATLYQSTCEEMIRALSTRTYDYVQIVNDMNDIFQRLGRELERIFCHDMDMDITQWTKYLRYNYPHKLYRHEYNRDVANPITSNSSDAMHIVWYMHTNRWDIALCAKGQHVRYIHTFDSSLHGIPGSRNIACSDDSTAAVCRATYARELHNELIRTMVAMLHHLPESIRQRYLPTSLTNGKHENPINAIWDRICNYDKQ